MKEHLPLLVALSDLENFSAFWDPEITLENFLRNAVENFNHFRIKYICWAEIYWQIVTFQRKFWKYGIRNTKFKENI